MAKKYRDNSITGERGVVLIKSIVLEMGWLPRELSNDTGIDLYIELRDTITEEMTGQIMGVQSKATATPFASETDTSFIFRVSYNDYAYWCKSNIPVILVVSRPDDNEAYWHAVDKARCDQTLDWPSVELKE